MKAFIEVHIGGRRRYRWKIELETILGTMEERSRHLEEQLEIHLTRVRENVMPFLCKQDPQYFIVFQSSMIMLTDNQKEYIDINHGYEAVSEMVENLNKRAVENREPPVLKWDVIEYCTVMKYKPVSERERIREFALKNTHLTMSQIARELSSTPHQVQYVVNLYQIPIAKDSRGRKAAV